MFLLNSIFPLIYIYLRPFIKWFLHQFTRLSELQRLLYGIKPGTSRTRKVEKSLQLSKNVKIKAAIHDFDQQIEYCNNDEFISFVKQLVHSVLIGKKIKPRLHPDFPRLLAACVEQIWGYKRLLYVIENLRVTQYDADNLEHEEKLLDLWNLLIPDVELEARVTKQWQYIGFQGDDPKTDFRGMGILGLENLLYFAREYNKEAQHVLSHSHHPQHGYTFAIVGINLTSMAYKLFKSGQAKTHIYNISRGPCNLEHFHKFYCYLFFEFDRFWLESKPRSIMDFSVIHGQFEKDISRMLECDNTVFKMNLVVDNI